MRVADARSSWLMSFTRAAGQECRLVCFPHAGGSGSVFSEWQRYTEALLVSGVCLPGRERRMAEPAVTELDELADALLTGLEPLYGAPFAFYGHSMGALVAYEVTARLRARGGPLPEALFVAGRDGPQHPDIDPAHALPRDELIEWLVDGDGLCPEALEYPELIDLMLPTIRADLRLAEGYRYRPRPPLPVPIHVLRGRGDRYASQEVDGGWARQTTAGCTVTWFDGGHFFVHEHERAIVALVERHLLPRAAAGEVDR